MSAAHTPGPWRYREDGSLIEADSAAAVACIDFFSVSAATGDANGRLIAAAPDLLAASKLALNLVGMIAFLQSPGDSRQLIDDLESAIAKAEGRTS